MSIYSSPEAKEALESVDWIHDFLKGHNNKKQVNLFLHNLDLMQDEFLEEFPIVQADIDFLRSKAKPRNSIKFVEKLFKKNGENVKELLNSGEDDDIVKFVNIIGKEIWSRPFELYSNLVEKRFNRFKNSHEAFQSIIKGDGGLCFEKHLALKFVLDYHGIESELVAVSVNKDVKSVSDLPVGWPNVDNFDKFIGHTAVLVKLGKSKRLIDVNHAALGWFGLLSKQKTEILLRDKGDKGYFFWLDNQTKERLLYFLRDSNEIVIKYIKKRSDVSTPLNRVDDISLYYHNNLNIKVFREGKRTPEEYAKETVDKAAKEGVKISAYLFYGRNLKKCFEVSNGRYNVAISSNKFKNLMKTEPKGLGKKLKQAYSTLLKKRELDRDITPLIIFQYEKDLSTGSEIIA